MRSIDDKSQQLTDEEEKVLSFIEDAPVSLTITDNFLEQAGMSEEGLRGILRRKLVRVVNGGYELWT